MAKLGINTGTTANDGTGDTLREAGGKINTNFDEIYSSLGDGTEIYTGIVTSIIGGDFISVSSPTGEVTITGLANTENINSQSLIVVGVSTLGIITSTETMGIGTIYTPRVECSGAIIGNTLVGDGSQITGLATTEFVVTRQLLVSGISTLGVVTGVTALQATDVYATNLYGDGSGITNIPPGIAAYAALAGLATDATYAGYATISGIATYAPNAGVATYAPLAGVSSYSSLSGVSTDATYAGYATTAGISTLSAHSITAGISSYSGSWVLGAGGTSNYTFTGNGFTGGESNPVLYLVRGQVYRFTNQLGIHPFQIQETPNGSVGTAYTDGVVGNGVTNGDLIFNVQFDAPKQLYYQCTAHNVMGGGIEILNNDSDFAEYSDIAGISTYASTSGVATDSTYSGYSVISGFSTASGVSTTSGYATSAGISTNSTYSTYSTLAGIATYATSAGVATDSTYASYSVTSGVSTYSNVSGIATYSGYATTSGFSTTSNYSTTSGLSSTSTYAVNAGVATNSTFAGYSEISGISTYSEISGVSTYASLAGIATYATNSGFTTNSTYSVYSSTSGIATYASTSGVSTTSGYADSSGISTNSTFAGYATTSGFSTTSDYSTNSGVSTTSGYATSAGIATYASTSGVSTTSGYATSAGIATDSIYSEYSVLSGIATYSSTSGVSTNSTFAGYSTLAGVSTHSGTSDSSTYASSSGISTLSNLAQGLTGAPDIEVNRINSSDIVVSTLTNNTGVTTLGIVTGATYYGDGSNLIGVLKDSTDQTFQNLEVVGVATVGIITSVQSLSSDDAFITNLVTGSVSGDGSGLTNVQAYGSIGLGFSGTYVGAGFTSIDLEYRGEIVSEFVAIGNTAYLTVTGLAATANTRSDSLVVTGISTLGIVTGVTSLHSGDIHSNSVTTSDISGDSLVISGLSTFNDNVSVGSTIVLEPETGRIYASEFYGDGSNLTGLGTDTISTTSLVVVGVTTLTQVNATSYFGDGSNLTGVARTSNILADSLVVTGVSTVSDLVATNLYGSGSNLTGVLKPVAEADSLVVTGISTFNDARAVSFTGGGGSLTGVLKPNDDINVNSLIVTGLSTVANVTSSGIVTATGGFISDTNSTAPCQITVVGSNLIFTVPGVGSTSLQLF